MLPSQPQCACSFVTQRGVRYVAPGQPHHCVYPLQGGAGPSASAQGLPACIGGTRQACRRPSGSPKSICLSDSGKTSFTFEVLSLGSPLPKALHIGRPPSALFLRQGLGQRPFPSSRPPSPYDPPRRFPWVYEGHPPPVLFPPQHPPLVTLPPRVTVVTYSPHS